MTKGYVSDDTVVGCFVVIDNLANTVSVYHSMNIIHQESFDPRDKAARDRTLEDAKKLAERRVVRYNSLSLRKGMRFDKSV